MHVSCVPSESTCTPRLWDRLTSYQEGSRRELLEEHHTLASEASREEDQDSSGRDAAAKLGRVVLLRGALGFHIVPSIPLGGLHLGLVKSRRQGLERGASYFSFDKVHSPRPRERRLGR